MKSNAVLIAIALGVAVAGSAEAKEQRTSTPAPAASIAAPVFAEAPAAQPAVPVAPVAAVPPAPAAPVAPVAAVPPAPAAPPAAAATPTYTMRTYVVGFLRRGPNWTPEKTAETQKLQEGHMANINRMAETGKLILAGPFSDSTDLRGMFVFDLTDVEEAKAMAEQDPAVQAGRLVIDWHPWFSASGIRSDATAPAPAAPPQ